MSEFLKNSNAICKIPEASEIFKYSSRIPNESMAEGIQTKNADGSSYSFDVWLYFCQHMIWDCSRIYLNCTAIQGQLPLSNPSFLYKTCKIHVNSQTIYCNLFVLLTRFCIILIKNNLYLEDFLVNGDCSIRCFHSKSRFMDSSRCSLRLSSSKNIEINVWR